MQRIATRIESPIGLATTEPHMGKKKTKCETATLKVVESDVSLDKNCRKWRKNLIKFVELTLNFIENQDRHESLIAYNYNI